jgi:hypothetical protein
VHYGEGELCSGFLRWRLFLPVEEAGTQNLRSSTYSEALPKIERCQPQMSDDPELKIIFKLQLISAAKLMVRLPTTANVERALLRPAHGLARDLPPARRGRGRRAEKVLALLIRDVNQTEFINSALAFGSFDKAVAALLWHQRWIGKAGSDSPRIHFKYINQKKIDEKFTLFHPMVDGDVRAGRLFISIFNVYRFDSII